MAENEKKELQKAEKKAAKAKSDKPSIWKRIGSWFKGLRAECKKITWTSWKEVKTSTFIVLVFVIVFAIVIGVLDYAFSGAISGLNGLVNLIRG